MAVVTICSDFGAPQNKVWNCFHCFPIYFPWSDAGRDWGQEEKGMPEDEMAGWHHWLDGWESEWTQIVGDGQGGVACCDSWVAKSRTWLSNWTELNIFFTVLSFTFNYCVFPQRSFNFYSKILLFLNIYLGCFLHEKVLLQDYRKFSMMPYKIFTCLHFVFIAEI